MESEWEFYSMKERWGEIGGVRMFLYTHVMYWHKNEFWDARVAGRYASRADLPPVEACVLQQIEKTDLWPPLEPGLRVCPEPTDNKPGGGLFVKRVRLAEYDGSPTLGQYVLHEARIGQRLRASPHPNLARFHGCAVGARGEVTGLCFDRYLETLGERMRRGAPVDAERCIEQVRAAVHHLHSLQLVHNDVTVDNVMFVNHGPALVLVDFDSCAARGGGLPKKRGPVPDGAAASEFENDYVGLELVYAVLLRYQDATKSQR
ncbi:Protein kinase-like domain protein [Akanthomyces lecanii RCEF 1005]|uniref:EKC/KEOPS complex subunit BUD32 n=1 Tax=Akanthomyces lecanii RCEF 1005 TaxID=1081108 RepID=A0A162JXH7_CORDF|nr:Protein kinase-like domain protein [Akanthomyces lecanii RCEF 1005]